MPNQVLLGIPVLKQEYDYGATSPTRQTATTYLWQEKSGSAYWTANLLTLPASVVTKDGNGNRVAETDYTYDQSAYLTTSGITVQSSPPNGTTRGNLTTATRWLNTGTSPVSHTNWYDTGEVYQQIDPLTYTTAYNYSSAYAGSLPTSITNALGQTIIYTYDFNTGKVTSEKDPNNQIATYTYADPLARLTNVTYPDGGQKTYTYNDTASPVNVVASKLATPNPSVQQEFDVDGLGREITSKLLTDPDGVDYVTTTYDGPGRVNTVTNQYRTTSDPTYGLTTAYYDGLNRKTSEKGPDGSIQIWQYSGSTVTYTDQDQNSWKRTSDGFGRLVTVMEPNGLSQSPTMQTSYSYDLLNNLLSVTQWGGASGSQGVRARSFSYDSLSRLLTATNPETGTVCYGAWSGAACAGGYDVDGNLKVKTDARSVVVNYAYDHLNRLLSKSYANDHSGTLFSCYQYDSSAPASCGASPNLVGRLVNEWTQSPSVGACALALPSAGFSTRRSILAYDAMGRVRCEQQCTPSNCASSSSYSPTYAYDFAGDLESLGVGTASFSYSYQGAGRLLTLTSNGTGPTFSGPLFSAQTGSSTPCPGSTSASYAAFGGLMNAAYGNGLTLNRGYDTRLRTTCETDTGSLVINPTSSSATVTITGKEQSN
jgi:YD repeat-containing protein